MPFTDFYNITLEHIDFMEEYRTWQNYGNSSRSGTFSRRRVTKFVSLFSSKFGTRHRNVLQVLRTKIFWSCDVSGNGNRPLPSSSELLLTTDRRPRGAFRGRRGNHTPTMLFFSDPPSKLRRFLMKLIDQ